MANGKTILDVAKYVGDDLKEWNYYNHPQRMADEALYTQNAHSAIDDLIIANTLQEILHTKRGESMDILYQATTKEGSPRYIHRNVPGLPTDERREFSGNMLRNLLEQNPQFADTLSLEEGKKRLAPQQSIMSQLKSLLGF
jgi:hypothetical protein